MSLCLFLVLFTGLEHGFSFSTSPHIAFCGPFTDFRFGLLEAIRPDEAFEPLSRSLSSEGPFSTVT